jgi:hypothetical protein
LCRGTLLRIDSPVTPIAESLRIDSRGRNVEELDHDVELTRVGELVLTCFEVTYWPIVRVLRAIKARGLSATDFIRFE